MRPVWLILFSRDEGVLKAIKHMEILDVFGNLYHFVVC